MINDSKSKTLINLWLGTGILLIIAMVAIGGITRLTGSGLSIVEWKVISGTIPPLSETQWQVTFEKYKLFPQYQKLNHDMTLHQFKNIFWWEYVHRLLGRVIGIVFIFPFIIAFRKKVLPAWLIRRLVIIFAFGALQAFVGWFMVKSGLADVPHVSHFRLALHLSMALLLIAIILWTMLDYNNENCAAKNQFGEVTMFSTFCMFLLIIQIVLGAFVAGLKAGYSYNTYPLMGGRLVPNELTNDLSNLSYNGVALQFIHRWFAWLVFICVVVLVFRIRAGGYSKKLMTYTNTFAMLLVLQIVVGITTLMLQVPVLFAVIHQLIAVFLFISLIIIIYFLRNETSLSKH